MCFLKQETALVFFTDPQEVCEGLLPQIIMKQTMKQFVADGRRGATPSVASIPARHFEPRMKHVLKRWETWDILFYIILGER
jgi:hypothetical protein